MLLVVPEAGSSRSCLLFLLPTQSALSIIKTVSRRKPFVAAHGGGVVVKAQDEGLSDWSKQTAAYMVSDCHVHSPLC
jgi:hypothetical protein